MSEFTFYLGTHQPAWLKRYDFPMFVNHTVLRRYKTLPEALSPWVFDSGGFATLATHGKWTTNVKSYSYRVERMANEVGNLVWAAPMDWMCESGVVKKTGLSIPEHQRRTVESYKWLHDRLGDRVAPVLQGWTVVDYLRCHEMYWQAGIDLTEKEVVGVGSVCRRGQTTQIVKILERLSREDINLHAFGVKGDALRLAKPYLVSADSMAWSFQARRLQKPMFPECVGQHKNCANCPRYAIDWRDKFLTKLEA